MKYQWWLHRVESGSRFDILKPRTSWSMSIIPHWICTMWSQWGLLICFQFVNQFSWYSPKLWSGWLPYGVLNIIDTIRIQCDIIRVYNEIYFTAKQMKRLKLPCVYLAKFPVYAKFTPLIPNHRIRYLLTCLVMPNVFVMYHNTDVMMRIMASQITNLTIVYSTVSSGADQRKHQSSASLAFVQGIHRWPVNSPHKWPVTRKMIPSIRKRHHVLWFYMRRGPVLLGSQKLPLSKTGATNDWFHNIENIPMSRLCLNMEISKGLNVRYFVLDTVSAHIHLPRLFLSTDFP